MNLLEIIRKFFNEDKPKEDKPSLFSIEFYPITNRYYPKYKHFYMGKNYSTGVIEPKEDYLFTYALFTKTEAEADDIIKIFKEQQLKENIRIIKK